MSLCFRFPQMKCGNDLCAQSCISSILLNLKYPFAFTFSFMANNFTVHHYSPIFCIVLFQSLSNCSWIILKIAQKSSSFLDVFSEILVELQTPTVVTKIQLYFWQHLRIFPFHLPYLLSNFLGSQPHPHGKNFYHLLMLSTLFHTPWMVWGTFVNKSGRCQAAFIRYFACNPESSRIQIMTPSIIVLFCLSETLLFSRRYEADFQCIISCLFRNKWTMI